MNVNQTTIAHARLALKEAMSGLLFNRNVNLIDFGQPTRKGQLIEDDLSIRIHVHKKLSGFSLETAIERGNTCFIPEYIGGFKTDVIEGTYYPHWFNSMGNWQKNPKNPRALRAEIMKGGISISDEMHYTYGTLGGKVIDRLNGAEMILSNWHVLVASWGTRLGQRIYQPGRGDGGNWTDTVATYTRDAMASNLDAAVATLNGRRHLTNDQFDLSPATGVVRAEIGMEVVKSGRKSNITFGRVTGIEGIAKIQYDHVNRIMFNIVTIEPLYPWGEVSAGGDSGSWWLNLNTKQALGLHFAGSNSPERALAHDMLTVLDALNIDIVTSNPKTAFFR